MTTTSKKVGYIGLGNLGFHLAHNLLKAGHTVTVTDLNKDLAAPLLAAGARWADTAKDVAAASDVAKVRRVGIGASFYNLRGAAISFGTLTFCMFGSTTT